MKKNNYEEDIRKSIDARQKILETSDTLEKIDKSVKLIEKSLLEGKKIWFFGNGGSYGDAQHLASELCGRVYCDRQVFCAEILGNNAAYVSAVSNDFHYNEVLPRLVRGMCSPGDVLFLLSTSGKSKNIILAIEEAKKKNINSIGLTGELGGEMKNSADIWIPIPSSENSIIQEGHMLIGHIIIKNVEENIVKKL